MNTLDDVAVEGRRVLVRADLNVPLDGDRIADDGRIRASLPTLIALINRGARVIVCSHLGRPGGRPNLKYSLAPVAARLGRLLGQEVDFPGDIVGTRPVPRSRPCAPAAWSCWKTCASTRPRPARTT
jgi:phosphoglycerate kinase